MQRYAEAAVEEVAMPILNPRVGDVYERVVESPVDVCQHTKSEIAAAVVYCIECGNPTNSNGSGYCPSCYVRFTPDGFFVFGDHDA